MCTDHVPFLPISQHYHSPTLPTTKSIYVVHPYYMYITHSPSPHYIIQSPLHHTVPITSSSPHYIIQSPLHHPVPITSSSPHYIIQSPLHHPVPITSSSPHYLTCTCRPVVPLHIHPHTVVTTSPSHAHVAPPPHLVLPSRRPSLLQLATPYEHSP